MGKYAKVNRASGIVESVAEYPQPPQVADNERGTTEYVEVSRDVEVGHPLPADARVQQR
jgi:hypothetical protein